MNHDTAIAGFSRFDSQLTEMAESAVEMADTLRERGDLEGAEACAADARACLEARYLPRLRTVDPVTTPLTALAEQKRATRQELYGGFTVAERLAR